MSRQQGDTGYEACDDGGVAGDGCADDCSAITDGYECLEWGEPCTLKCGNGHVEGFRTPQVDSRGVIVYDVILSTDVDGFHTYDTTSNIQYVFEYEMNAAGDAVREECDLGRASDGGFNSPRSLADSTYEDVYMYVCSSDCKLIENKWRDPAGANYNADTADDSNPSNFKKWECTIDMTEVDWSAKDIKNQTRVIYEQKCNYLCGNQNLEWDTAGETCDIGGWSHLSLTSQGYHSAADGTGTLETDWKTISTWIFASEDNQAPDYDNASSNPKKSTNLGLGCTKDCRAFADGTNTFKYDDRNYSDKGTDRCGDGIMDGVISYTNTTAAKTMNLQGVRDTNTYDQDGNCCFGSYSITGYVPYWDTEYKDRILDEECDNGGDEDHGCDRLCRIVSGWECFNYYHHLLSLESPLFTSKCQEIDKTITVNGIEIEMQHSVMDPDVDRRRLTPEDFDKHGRRLDHMPRRAYLITLPSNTHEMRPGKHTLKFDPKGSLNGQVRVIESTLCANCFGFSMAYQVDETTKADWFYYQTSDSASTVSEVSVLMTEDSNAMKGKQRNTFGAYMVVNKNKQQL